MSLPPFIFVTSQIGAELALKAEMARRYPGWKPAFSRPGFITFKLEAAHGLGLDFRLDAVFARAWGYSLGPLEAQPENLPARIWELAGDRDYQAVHVFPRDRKPSGLQGYTVKLEPDDLALADALRGMQPQRDIHRWTRPGDLVLDVIRIDDQQFWLGFHQANTETDTWPGGFCQITPPLAMVSRAYLKMEEALRWSGFDMRPGERCVELGCSPGGAAQALLEHGLAVTGVDPADIDARVESNPNFIHIRKRGADVRRREFRRFRWLTADMNVAPTYTLDTVEAIVTYPEVPIRGLLLTLKLLEWKLAAEIPDYLFRIRTWGFTRIKARQLHHNHQEICVAAERADT